MGYFTISRRSIVFVLKVHNDDRIGIIHKYGRGGRRKGSCITRWSACRPKSASCSAVMSQFTARVVVDCGKQNATPDIRHLVYDSCLMNIFLQSENCFIRDFLEEFLCSRNMTSWKKYIYTGVEVGQSRRVHFDFTFAPNRKKLQRSTIATFVDRSCYSMYSPPSSHMALLS